MGVGWGTSRAPVQEERKLDEGNIGKGREEGREEGESDNTKEGR